MAQQETRKVSSTGDLIEIEEVLSSRNDENKLYNVLSKICDSINNLGKDTKAIRKSQDTLHSKMDNLEGKLKALEESQTSAERKMKGLEESNSSLRGELEVLKEQMKAINTESGQEEDYKPAVTIVASNMPYRTGEDTYMKACDLIYNHLDLHQIQIIQAKRTPERGGKPGLVKIELGSTDEKISVLRQKSKLARTSGEYKNVYLRSSKPHMERMAEINFRTLLRELPNGNRYRLTGSGRIIPRDQNDRIASRAVNRSDHARPPREQHQDTRRGTSPNLQSQEEFPSLGLMSQSSLFTDNRT